MGIKRVVDTDFWTDGKVDEFSPEDKYFMLYILTNPFVTLLGIYQLSIKQAAFQMGYSMEAVRVLLDRFQNKYGMILYSEPTGEIAILNFLRHSVVKGGEPVRDCISRDIKRVKNKDLIDVVFNHVKRYSTLNVTVRAVIDEYEKQNQNSNYNLKDNDIGTGYGYGYGESSPNRERIVDESSKTDGDDKQKNAPDFASFTPEDEKQIKKSPFFDERLKEVINLWDRASGRIMTGWESQQLVELLDLYGKDRVVQAINAAAANNSVKINYVTAVLENRGKKANTADNKSKLTPEQQADLDAWLRGE